MASISIAEAITYINTLGERAAKRAAEIMKEEVPVRTGALRDSIDAIKVDSNTWSVAPEYKSVPGKERNYAAAVNNGRRAVTKSKGVLQIHSSTLKQLPDHFDDMGYIYTKHVSAIPPNNYIARTKERMEKEHFSLVP